MEQDPITHRKRAPNYSNNEKELLLNVINTHKHIIENKKTDGVSVAEKKDTWQKICQEFNNLSPNLHYRPAESLKKYYEKMEEELRKKTAEHKKELYKTGGGPGPGPAPNGNDQPDELLLSIINKKSVLGLGSLFDSNNESVIIMNHTQNPVENSASTATLVNSYEISEVENTTEADLMSQQADLEMPDRSNTIEIVYEDSEKSRECLPSHIWKKGENLKRPINNILKQNVNKITHTPAKKKCETPTRRRPNTVVPLTSSRLGEKYELLVEKKLELVQCLHKEHELRMQALQLDILIKKKQLASLGGLKDSEELLLESQTLF